MDWSMLDSPQPDYVAVRFLRGRIWRDNRPSPRRKALCPLCSWRSRWLEGVSAGDAVEMHLHDAHDVEQSVSVE